MISSYIPSSKFRNEIQQFVEMKKAFGFSYDSSKGTLMNFDNFCITNGMDNGVLDRELVMAWSQQLPSECINTRNTRVSVVRQFALYLNAKGCPAYLPPRLHSQPIAPPHILSDEELIAFFAVVDAYVSPERHLFQFSLIYPVIYRMLYCCGLRLAEACHLPCSSVNLTSGELTIQESKGAKDRKLYMPEDLRTLCISYDQKMNDIQPCRQWFFPSLDPSKHVHKSNISGKFKEFWSYTPYAKTVDKRPTTHCLRHTFVVNRVNRWILEGETLENWLPYLCKHLGHSRIADTWYYYHMVENALPIFLRQDLVASKIIPEVRHENEIE
jgi:integrase